MEAGVASATESAIYRTDVVGSLLRPPWLVQARQELRAGALPLEAYKEIEDRAVAEAIAIQEQAGVDVVTDGEMRRDIFFDVFVSGMTGFSRAVAHTVRFRGKQAEDAMAVQVPFTVTDKIAARSSPALEQFLAVKDKTERPVKVTLPSPMLIGGFWSHVEVSNFTIGSVPAWLSRFSSATGTTFGIGLPPVIVMWAVVAVIVGIVLAWTKLGRRVYQTGSNPAAAGLALINTGRVWTAAFALSAASAAVVGVLLAGFSGSADATVGTQYLFTSLAAVIVGGTSITGARGDYWRTVLGALIITVLSTVLLGHGYSIGDQQIAFGLAILVVVAGYGRDVRLRDRV